MLKIIKLSLLKLHVNLNILYEKIIKRSKKYHAHDEKNKFKEGEKVSIEECKLYSKENLAGDRIMIQIQTELTVADNTGARVECIKVLGGSKKICFCRRYNCNKCKRRNTKRKG